jgi:CubicO group peptidase (beta-lactamase class C family)
LIASGHVDCLHSYGDLAAQSYLASVRKSILSMLYGIEVARGKIDTAKTLAMLRIDDRGGLLPREKDATIQDLLGARSGVYHIASYPGDFLAEAPPRGSQKHGEYQLYSNWDFNVLGTIFEQETGRNLYDALDQELARPLQMQDFRRDLQTKQGDSTRSVHAAYPIFLTTGRVVSQLLSGTQTRRIGPLVKQYPEPRLELHPRLAARLGVADGDWTTAEPRRATNRPKAQVVTSKIAARQRRRITKRNY